MFPSIIPKMVALMNHCYGMGVLPKSWRMAILRVLPKEDKDSTIVTNYRPIALMCCDYKLMASVLAACLQEEIAREGYFPVHQTGFVKGGLSMNPSSGLQGGQPARGTRSAFWTLRRPMTGCNTPGCSNVLRLLAYPLSSRPLCRLP